MFRILNPACSGIFYFKSMREELLHFIWKNRKLSLDTLQTTDHSYVCVKDFGTHNRYSGPDFLNARIEINGQWWAGNVEIHQKSSDWYAHGHQNDIRYDSVILHVVWEADRAVFRSSGELIPTLQLQDYVQEDLLIRYRGLLFNLKKRFINCEPFEPASLADQLNSWPLQLYKERLDQKLQMINGLFKSFKKDWERLLFVLLLRNFGSGVNSESFASLARAIDFRLFIRLRADRYQLECLLFGMAGLLDEQPDVDEYFAAMRQEYLFLVRKFDLIQERTERPEFMGVRPSGFPTIRLSQFAGLYANSNTLFHRIAGLKKLESCYELFEQQASDYWSTHYSFGKISRRSVKKLSKSFINNIIINTILPLKRLYGLEYGLDNYNEILDMIRQIRPETNSLITGFKSLGFAVSNALDSQGLLHLHKNYCRKNRCLECSIGNRILN